MFLLHFVTLRESKLINKSDERWQQECGPAKAPDSDTWSPLGHEEHEEQEEQEEQEEHTLNLHADGSR